MWNSMSNGIYDYNEDINDEVTIYFNKKGDIKVYFYGVDTPAINIYDNFIQTPKDFEEIAPVVVEDEDYFKKELNDIIEWILRKEWEKCTI